YVCDPNLDSTSALSTERRRIPWRAKRVQSRLALKAQVAEVYNRLLAHLRWSLTALEGQWVAQGRLQPGDIFFLTLDEVREAIAQPVDDGSMQAAVERRRAQWQADGDIPHPAQLVYGEEPPAIASVNLVPWSASGTTTLQGIGASPGQAVGRVLVLDRLATPSQVDKETILVVPYTDAGWAPLLAQAGGIVAQVGGRLSHGAIIAREFSIPAVMNVTDATQRLQTGQRVQVDGQQGTVMVL
ncbi:MAG: PEP-utilizing enzyme, partial [Cyanobacteria bacterium P01_A01_bin.135]